MEKVYRLLQWLDSAQAVDWLQSLTYTAITHDELLELWRSGHCKMFVNCNDLTGKPVFSDKAVRGADFVELDRFGDHTFRLGNDTLFAVGANKVYIKAKVMAKAKADGWFGLGREREIVEETDWEAETLSQILFKPADIEALAAKMNGVPEQPGAAGLEDLRQQLKQERAAREADQLRAELADAEAQPSHLLAIAGLLELLLDDSRPRYNQGSAAEAIAALHPDWRGASTSKLTKLFAEAKAAAKEADKVAQAKAEAREAAVSRAIERKTVKT